MKSFNRVIYSVLILLPVFFSCSGGSHSGHGGSNKNPVAFDQSLSVRINHFADIELGAEDPNSDPLTYFINRQTEHGSLVQLGLSE